VGFSAGGAGNHGINMSLDLPVIALAFWLYVQSVLWIHVKAGVDFGIVVSLEDFLDVDESRLTAS
jgi:hypothetical protein